MEYPYITMIKKYNSQIIMEICNEFFNYRIIIKKIVYLMIMKLILKNIKKQKEIKLYLFLNYINIII